MTRRVLFAMGAAFALSTTVAFADVTQAVVAQLQGMGFTRVVVERTLLGRVKIEATGADGNREIIINPRTGEILRDVFWPIGTSRDSRLLGIAGSGGDGDRDDDDDNSGSGGGDDDNNSSTGGDDDDDDSSGSGGGDDSADDDDNSGSGGGDDSSGSGGDDDDDSGDD